MGLRIALIALGIGAILGTLYWVYNHGREVERSANETRNMESGRRADRGDDALTNCDGLFDFWTQECKRAP